MWTFSINPLLIGNLGSCFVCVRDRLNGAKSCGFFGRIRQPNSALLKSISIGLTIAKSLYSLEIYSSHSTCLKSLFNAAPSLIFRLAAT